MGNLDQAAAHFEDALVLCRKGGYRPELAWRCCDYADCLVQRNGLSRAERNCTSREEGNCTTERRCEYQSLVDCESLGLVC